ncbi:trehalose operon repressor [Ornithinibacillus contaminans]|uniref:trehalose operon repressor n=1 Tax=Ornithinibacillus contaminans TaxID=694055 RepID=UPI00064DDD92|nr:trehalose operon repressor [Ornithinibacillus contaminans]
MQKKYVTIYDELVTKIKHGEWAAFSMLPSENELALLYNTSRETVRKALNLLSQNGYIQKIQGKGSMILDVNKFSFPVSGIVSFKELATNLKLDTRTKVIDIGYVDKEQPIYSKFQIDSGRIWHVTRVREITGERIIVDKDYFAEEFVPLLSKEICQGSVYEHLEQDLGLTIGFAQKEITVEEPTEEDKALLDLQDYNTIVVIKSLVYLDDASLFQITESRHRPDKFRFVDFARRMK